MAVDRIQAVVTALVKINDVIAGGGQRRLAIEDARIRDSGHSHSVTAKLCKKALQIAVGEIDRMNFIRIRLQLVTETFIDASSFAGHDKDRAKIQVINPGCSVFINEAENLFV